jgi:3-isopropylmalate/(R)-2-methylmalate dehydratase small subunit
MSDEATMRSDEQGGGHAWVYGDNVDTDVIIPARYLVTSDAATLAQHCMEDIDPMFAGAVRPGDVIVAGSNFGCGSSREHAPWALRDFGFRAIVAPSFADIFRANCYKTGLLAVTLPDSQVRHLIDLAEEDPAAQVTVDLERQEVRGDGFSYRFEIDPFARNMLLNGLDEISLIERHEPDIAAYERNRADWLPTAL